MASKSHNTILTLSLLVLLLTLSEPRLVRTPFKPNTLFLPLRRDNATGLHVTTLRKRTPLITVPLLLDLNGPYLWLNCDDNYTSASYHAPFCHSTLCARAGVHYCHRCSSNTPSPGCHNNTCAVVATNPLTRRHAISELAADVVSIQSIGDLGFDNTQWVSVPQFLFACAPSSLLKGPRPPGVRGIAALSHTSLALPLQLSSHFGFHPQFALCLSSSIDNHGGIFFGNLTSKLRPRIMAYTPLTIGAQGEYFIPVKSIKINNLLVPFNTSLLSRTRTFGGAMISTTNAYTVLEHSVFITFTRFFAEQLSGVPQVKAVPPFGLCFDARILPPTRVGTPNIDFVLQNKNVSWRVFGVDAMVRVRSDVACLGFVDGGSNARAAITIGVYQLENNFVEFDLMRSRLGFIPSRLSDPSFSCSNFNFTSAHDDVFSLEFDGIGV